MKKITKICGLCAVAMLIPGVILLGAGFLLGGTMNAAVTQDVLLPGSPFASEWADASTTCAEERIDIKQGSGSFYLPVGVESADAIEIEVNAGSVELNKGDAFMVMNQDLSDNEIDSYMNGTVWHIEVASDTNQGTLHITVPESTVFQSITVESNVGSITGTGADAVYFEAETNVGSIKLTNVNAQMMQLNADAGSIEISGHAEQSASIDVNVGSVVLSVPKPSEYGYEVGCEVGKVTLFDETFTGMESHKQFNKDKAFSLSQVPLFILNCEMGEIQVLGTE